MNGLWLEGGRVAFRSDLEPPAAAPEEAVLRVVAAGLCGTDLELLRGYRPFAGIPGHEFVGIVERGPAEWVGARAVSEINVTCRSYHERERPPCPTCTAGRASHCERRTVIGILGRDGGFAERVAVPVANLHRIPDGIPDEHAVFVEPLAAAFRVLEQVDPRPDDRILVVGPGRLGQLVARALATRAGRLEVAGRSPEGLRRLAEHGIATRDIGEIEDGACDIAIDCTGHPDGFGIARRALRPGGVLVLKSTYAGEVALDASALVVDEIRLVGSRCGPFPVAIDALAGGRVEVGDLIDGRLPLSDGVRAFERAAEPGVAKILLTFS